MLNIPAGGYAKSLKVPLLQKNPIPSRLLLHLPIPTNAPTTSTPWPLSTTHT